MRDGVAATVHEDVFVWVGNGWSVEVDRFHVRPDIALLPVLFDLLERGADCLSDREVVGRLPAVATPVLPEVGDLLRTVPVEADDISWRFTGKGWLRQFVNRGGLLRRTGPEQVDSVTTPVLQLRVLGGLDMPYPSGYPSTISSASTSNAFWHFGTTTNVLYGCFSWRSAARSFNCFAPVAV